MNKIVYKILQLNAVPNDMFCPDNDWPARLYVEIIYPQRPSTVMMKRHGVAMVLIWPLLKINSI